MLTELLYNMGIIEQLVGLLSMEHAGFHEHLVAALYHAVVDNEQAQRECHRPEFKLESLLKQRQQLLQGKDEFQVNFTDISTFYSSHPCLAFTGHK